MSNYRRVFLEGSQHHYYSVWKVVYFPQNPLNLKSKKVKFPKGKILPLGVWLHKFPKKKNWRRIQGRKKNKLEGRRIIK